ncbi:MAG: phosphoglucosamine mutase [Acidimicrobiia bacterium]|nr:phosphoglucosamine mutase [Acidimicrobiia bacterium]
MSTLRFGTDGVRGPASAFDDRFVAALGLAAARVLGPTSGFVVGRDTRESGARIERALGAGLRAAGVGVVSLGVAPTPAVAWVGAQRALPGAVISASHNQWTDNGIKFFAAGGRKLVDAVESRLESELDAILAGDLALDRALELVSTADVDVTVDDGAVSGWCAAVVASCPADVSALRVVIDCANGASSTVAPTVLRSLGLDPIVLHAAPDGRNINDACGSTHPDDLCRTVIAAGADVGLAFDGDADRLLAVDERGALVDGDQLLAMFATDLRRRGLLRGDRLVVTVMSNLGLRLRMDELGIEVVETPVGDRHVLEALDRVDGSLGGEQSGHIVFSDLATTGDGVLSGVRLLALLADAGRPLSLVAADSMDRLPQVLVNVPVAVRRSDIAEVLADEISAAEAELAGAGRVLLRPSGTEPLVRVMVEATSESVAEAVAMRLAAEVERVGGA